MTSRRALPLLVLISAATSACATMNNQGSQTIIAKSADHQPGVQVEIVTKDGSYLSSLPSTVVGRSSWSGIEIKIVDPCYVPSTYEVPRSVTRSFWANLVFVYGFLIDPLTGYMWNYDDRIEVPVKRKSKC